MNRLSTFLLGVVLGGTLMFSALKYHLVRADDGWHFIPKITNQMGAAYVDIRHYTAAQWAEHQTLALAIAQSDKKYLLSESVADEARQATRDMFRPWRKQTQ